MYDRRKQEEEAHLKNGLFLDGNLKARKQNEDLGVHGADSRLDLSRFSR